MSNEANSFLKKALGDDFFESLAKVELWKPGTKTTVDHEEIKTALQIVPRVVMSMLIRELSPMSIGETKEIALGGLPFRESFVDGSAMMRVTKHERDVYSGEIIDENKAVVDFKYRSLPGIGLIILTSFEMYDISKLKDAEHEDLKDDAAEKIQKIIDERLALHDLIGKVVDKKITEREAVSKMFLSKLTEAMDIKPVEKAEEIKKPKGSPKLQQFIDSRKSKKKEFSIELTKGETVDCPDCGKNIYNGSLFSGCICLGDDMERKVFIKKSEDGIKVRFSKGWDQENIEMLLEVLRRKRG